MYQKFISLYNFLLRIIELTFSGKIGFYSFGDFIKFSDILKIRHLLFNPSQKVICDFELIFQNMFNLQNCIAFASARMAFHSFLCAISISKDDEIIVTAGTCSVMINAIIRTGAKPVFLDIDPLTFGTSISKLSTLISDRTRVIVVQHSFGIPSDIEQILEIARESNIYIVEDCALSLGSKVNGYTVGSLGDASIFSFDSTKPIPIFIGGMISIKSNDISKKVRAIQKSCSDLPISKLFSIYNNFIYRFIINAIGCNSLLHISYFVDFIKCRLFKSTGCYLNEDYLPINNTSAYPYPSKLPSFLAAIGIIWLSNWEEVSRRRKENLSIFIEALRYKRNVTLPGGYLDAKKNIIPLRLIFYTSDRSVLDALKKEVDIFSFWFREPVICRELPLEAYGYISGSCPNIETYGPLICNLPVDISTQQLSKLLRKVF